MCDYCCSECREVYMFYSLTGKFKAEMLNKMFAKLNEGYSGWNDDSDEGLIEHLWLELKGNIDKAESFAGQNYNFRAQDLIDIANYCAFIWNLIPEKNNGN